MNSSTFLSGLAIPNEPLTIEPVSLCATLAQVTDRRGKKGRLYRASIVLTLVVLAKLAGQTDPTNIARWVRLRQDWLCQALNLKRGRLPCANTYIYVCQNVELTELNNLLGKFFNRFSKSVVPPSSLSQPPQPQRAIRHLAIDGKALKSTLNCARNGCVPVHLLELYDVATGHVLTQLNVETKENEITVAPRLLEGQALADCLITADAFHTQREWCKKVKGAGADWLVFAKGNQPGLVADLALLFEDEFTWPAWLEKRRAQSCDKGHGRIEERRLLLSSELKEFLAEKWYGVEQVFRLERRISKGGKVREEVVYGMLSLPAELADAQQVLEYIRRHWRIENRLHWRKDVTLKEDACLSRRGQVPQVLAALNNVVLGLMDHLKVKNVPQQMQYFQAYPTPALKLLVDNIIL
jgi:predicted transposase YbfD/YdcC